MISEMLSTSRHVRRHAFDRLEVDRENAWAARELLATDADAQVRARAAFFLGRMASDIALPALHDALEDEMPLVRHAAVRALATCGGESSFERASRLALEDPIWWVRRAAVIASAVLGKSRSIDALRESLEDPFWRVRNAAVRALLSLGEDRDALLERLGVATSPRSEGALSYIARRLGAPARTHVPLDVPNAIVAQLDPDPAVVAARLERGDAVTPAFLVECLGDPHQVLRANARKRLARSRDLRAFELALLWLDEPRFPHAAQTVITLLDALEREDVDHVLDVAFRGGFGAVAWAASYVGLTADASRRDALLAHLRHDHPLTRAAVVAALGMLGDVASVRPMTADADPRVVRAALQALWEAREPLTMTDGIAYAAPLRRIFTASAAERGELASLRAASHDEDARVRAIAIEARAAHGDLDLAEREALLADPDPWIRTAALDDASAERVLASDPQPWVRRAAFRLLVRTSPARAAELACACDDSWLKTRGIARLDPRDSQHLVMLLELSRDRSSAVRATAADALERESVDEALDALLATPLSDAARIGALVHRSRRFEAEDFARLHAAREEASEPVRAWLDDALDLAPPREAVARTVTITPAPLRPLGATGLRTAALVVSGAGILPARAYAAAMHAGCNLFFWEPRYHTLGRMLSRERDAGVVAGTYEASERAIVSDVERSLRRLGRDTLDVFLLFWARSPARVDAPIHEILARLKSQGKIRAFGFSTHDRTLACDAMSARPWDVVMTRHSAVHPGAEARVFPLAREKNVGVLAFSALSYGRALGPSISATEAYRYALSQPGVAAVLSAPRTTRELDENLAALRAPPLPASRQAELRAFGKTVHEESADFARSIRRHPDALPLTSWLDHEDLRSDTRLVASSSVGVRVARRH